MEQNDRDELNETMAKTTGDAAGSSPPKPGEPLLQFFEYAHLPQHLAKVSANFHDLALEITKTLPRNPERTVALRKLLEAKDCAVRAVLYDR